MGSEEPAEFGLVPTSGSFLLPVYCVVIQSDQVSALLWRHFEYIMVIFKERLDTPAFSLQRLKKVLRFTHVGHFTEVQSTPAVPGASSGSGLVANCGQQSITDQSDYLLLESLRYSGTVPYWLHLGSGGERSTGTKASVT